MREWESFPEEVRLTMTMRRPTDRPIIEMLSLLCRRMYVLPLPRLQPSLRVARLRPWHTNTHTHRRGIPTIAHAGFRGKWATPRRKTPGLLHAPGLR